MFRKWARPCSFPIRKKCWLNKCSRKECLWRTPANLKLRALKPSSMTVTKKKMTTMKLNPSLATKQPTAIMAPASARLNNRAQRLDLLARSTLSCSNNSRGKVEVFARTRAAFCRYLATLTTLISLTISLTLWLQQPKQAIKTRWVSRALCLRLKTSPTTTSMTAVL